MIGLPEFFEQTSDEPYDRHDYRLISTDGNSVVMHDWQSVSAAWFQLPAMFKDRIEVLDKPKPRKTTKAIGF